MSIEGIPELEQQQKEKRPSGGFSLGSIVLLMGVLSVIVVVGMQFLNQQESRPTSGPAPEFTVTSFDGETFSVESQREAGNITVLNFWGSWCGPCRAEAPRLQQLHEDYVDRGVTVLGVTYLDEESDSRAFMSEYGLSFPSAPDPDLIVADRYNITGAPETFIIDENGDVVAFFLGEITDLGMTRLRNDLDTMLAEQ